ncbi:MAG: dipeptide epimerase [Bacteroidetes bacterium GWE2_41_25]|nr:MAG: dipeptide epimerase [Bacteroidetes bacterium GWA2_40_15]OFX91991.1 MAG: dipeptide epimerase [Bacteroidetes bacterium GWC2_40_22]OFY07395.1 MAG: dipeptide epimerase [Bacteroidetes bacterium GWE2_41_25]OFY56970.1 MAG: dipeptide epimerase [Bacteroidetes bacterium GWF2_41_9]HBH83409.1 dipeptide epimerase [Bacteroidales bacterium]
MTSRRDFLRNCGTLAGVAGFSYMGLSCNAQNDKQAGSGKGKGMTLRFSPYDLELKHVFTIATSSRKSTPVMLTEIEYDGLTGFGEASMPPYLGESHETVNNFLKLVDLARFSSPFLMEEILDYIEQLAPGNYAAKASVDIALHDLVGKLMNQPWYRIWGLNPEKTPFTSFTIGIDTPEVVREKVAEASPYRILKVKLGQDNDKEMIQTIRSVTDKALCVDVNQGWKERQMALDMIYWLKDQGVVFIEQPMPKSLVEDIAWLTQNSPLPVIADESVQTIMDVKKADGVYSGINIKLMKCGGMRSAFKMINTARALNMKVMIGCMTETSCAISAAAQLSPMVDWADLDGNLLIKNDLFEGVKIADGKIILPDAPGIGVKKL